jgi:signal transduction histidine kinase
MRQLEECFTADEERLTLIGALDKSILNTEVTPEVVAALALSGLCSHLRITAAHLMMKTVDGFRTTVSRPNGSHPLEFRLSTMLSDDRDSVDLRKVDPMPAFLLETSDEYRLVPITLYDTLAGAILIQADSPDAADESLADPFLDRIVDQLRIAYRTHRERRRRDLSEKVQEAFQATQLNLSLCLQWLIDEALSTVKFDADPLVEILIRSGDYLHMRRSNSAEAENTKVLMTDSATGRRLLEGGEPRQFDPRLEPSYKAMGADRGEMKSELVIPLVSGNEAYGAINLEATIENAFSDDIIRRLVELAVAAGPPLKGLIARTDMAIRDRQIMFYAVQTMCERLALLYNHKLQSPLHNCQFAVNLLSTEESRLNDAQRRQLFLNLNAGLSRLDQARLELFQNFDALVALGPHDLGLLVKEALRQFPDVNHAILFDARPWPPIYCARILREHIANVVQNAIDSIDLRLSEDAKRSGTQNAEARPGEITISIFPWEARDAKNLNQYLVLSIKDNGLGLKPGTEVNLFQAVHSTKGTSGVALTAARSFLHTIGGRIEVSRSRYGTDDSCCEFQMTFQIYDKNVHETDRPF